MRCLKRKGVNDEAGNNKELVKPELKELERERATSKYTNIRETRCADNLDIWIEEKELVRSALCKWMRSY